MSGDFDSSFSSDFSQIDVQMTGECQDFLNIPAQLHFKNQLAVLPDSIIHQSLMNKHFVVNCWEGCIPANTLKSAEMAIKAYRSWRECRISRPERSANSNSPILEVGPQMAHQVDFPRWNYWLAR